MSNKIRKLNLGCGTDIRGECVNLDIVKLPGVDVIWNLDVYPWPFKNNEFDEIYAGSNILGFVGDFRKAIEEIWRISKHNTKIYVESPLYPSINCFSDPHTKKIFTYNSFVYFEPGHKFGYYSNAKFRTIKREIILFRNTNLRFLNFIPNLFPRFYVRFLANIISADSIKFILEVKK